MQINFLTKGYVLKDNLRDIITKKIEKLDKFFGDETPIKVKLKESNDRHKLELTIMLGSVVLRSEVASDDMYKNIDLALPKLERQISRHFSKLDAKYKRGGATPPAVDVEPPHRVVRTKSYDLNPMSAQDALIEIERVEHDFYLFRNSETGKVSVIYKRQDGEYGMIEANCSL